MEITHIDALQPEYNLLQRKIEDGLLSYCADNQISVLSYNSIAKGILSGVFHFNGVKLDAEDFRNEKPLFFPENLETENCEDSLIFTRSNSKVLPYLFENYINIGRSDDFEMFQGMKIDVR